MTLFEREASLHLQYQQVLLESFSSISIFIVRFLTIFTFFTSFLEPFGELFDFLYFYLKVHLLEIV